VSRKRSAGKTWPAQSANAYLPVRGSQIYYETIGSGEPLLLLHGGLGTNQDFASQKPDLAKHFKVVAFERPGHGHTADISDAYGFNLMSGYTTDFIDALRLGPVNLVGWSDGAIISLLVAISRPDLVKSIVSVSGIFDAKAQSPGDLQWIASATPESFRKGQPALVKVYDEISPDGPAHFPVVFKKIMRMWLTEPNIRREELAAITAPTLVMAGDRDSVPAEHTMALFRSIKKSQLCIVPGSTHFLLAEKPEATTSAILDFLLAHELQ
jgi:pimeloyl-ACP methyl ester carboxylesterase